MGNIQAVIFDMDGVIFDTEPMHSRAWKAAMDGFGVLHSIEYYNEWIGIPDTKLGEHLEQEHPGVAEEGAFLEAKWKRFDRLLQEELVPFEGLASLLPRLEDRYRVGLATTSHQKDMDMMLELTGLTGHFSATSCFEDVTDHKPHPAPYLLAAERLGVTPAACVALDDSPSGVKSAKAAGMRTWGITSSFSPEDLAEADEIFPSTVEACNSLLK
ncbi:MAG: HAD family hydrolase [Planctomycetota bacterium]|jgi:HAD superfamily hydrolase (TIGR01509 family)